MMSASNSRHVRQKDFCAAVQGYPQEHSRQYLCSQKLQWKTEDIFQNSWIWNLAAHKMSDRLQAVPISVPKTRPQFKENGQMYNKHHTSV